MQAKQQQRKLYTQEFKREAVRLVSQGGHKEAQVARDLGLCGSLLGKWRRRMEEQSHNGQSGPRAFPGHGNARDEGVARLVREDAPLKEEGERLKKAAGIFTDGAPGHQSRPR